jgi:hypothetical protein
VIWYGANVLEDLAASIFTLKVFQNDGILMKYYTVSQPSHDLNKKQVKVKICGMKEEELIGKQLEQMTEGNTGNIIHTTKYC